jgi:hypothetical protein
MPVEPGVKQLGPQLVAPDEGGADVAAEDRGAVVPAARVTACDVPAVLAEATPQGGPARRGQRMGAHADDAITSIGADFTWFVKK